MPEKNLYLAFPVGSPPYSPLVKTQEPELEIKIRILFLELPTLAAHRIIMMAFSLKKGRNPREMNLKEPAQF